MLPSCFAPPPIRYWKWLRSLDSILFLLFAGLLSLHTNVRLMNIVRKCKYKLIRRIDAMTLRILRNDSLESRGVREDFVLLNLCFLPNDTRGFGKSCIFVAEFSRLGLLIICF